MKTNSLSADYIKNGLVTRCIGQQVRYFPRLTSTMDIARQEARRGAAEGTVIIADRQTAGKGRINRVWLSPEGSIALSVILYPPVYCLPYLVMLSSLAVVHTIETVTGLKPQIKWPNDIIINGKKVCGILIENEVQGNKVAFAITGIGINANVKVSDFAEVEALATSLAVESGRDVSRLELIKCLLAEIDKFYLALPAEGESIYDEWRDRLVTLGRNVRVTSGDNILTGVAESVDRDGSLLLRNHDGSSVRIVAGDVTLRDKLT